MNNRCTGTVKDFTEIDCAIMTRIAESACTFTTINAAVEHLAAPLATGQGRTYRVVDRRLQSLRKRGLIYFGATKWFLKK